jgi:hypothetical protein
MMATVNVPDEVLSKMVSEAQRAGVDPDVWLAQLIERAATHPDDLLVDDAGFPSPVIAPRREITS